MRLHLCRPAADHLFTEEGEPQPVSSCRADGRGSRSLARRLFFLLFFRRSRAVGGAIRPHRPQNPQALDFSSAVADTRGAAHPPPAPPSPQRKHRPKAGPAEPPAGPAHVWLGLDFPTSRPLTRGVPPLRTVAGGLARSDYARWTDEERRRFLDSSVSSSSRGRPASAPHVFGPRLGVAQGAFLAVIVSAVLFLLGHVPQNHPLIAALHFNIPRPPRLTHGSSSSPGLGKIGFGKISLARSAQLGSYLTFHGQLPSGESGTVTVEGAYRRPPWQLFAAVSAQAGSYAARIHLTRAGLLHVRLTYPDGHRSVGSIRVVR
jgi:hypothetical protein